MAKRLQSVESLEDDVVIALERYLNLVELRFFERQVHDVYAYWAKELMRARELWIFLNVISGFGPSGFDPRVLSLVTKVHKPISSLASQTAALLINRS